MTKHTAALTTLQQLLDSLPEYHVDSFGVRRALQVLHLDNVERVTDHPHYTRLVDGLATSDASSPCAYLHNSQVCGVAYKLHDDSYKVVPVEKPDLLAGRRLCQLHTGRGGWPHTGVQAECECGWTGTADGSHWATKAWEAHQLQVLDGEVTSYCCERQQQALLGHTEHCRAQA